MRKIFFLLLLLVCVTMNAQPQEELIIRNGDRNIFGILMRPVTSTTRQPVAIISHGFNGTHVFGKDYFKLMNELGYQCYTFDFPYGSVHSRSDNNTMNMSISNERADLNAIVDYFRSRPDVDPSNIVLIGESQGGLVSSLVAADKAKKISKLVLIYPALCIPDNWTERYPDVNAIPDTTRMWNVPLSKNFFMDVRGLDVYKTIKKFKRPVLIVHGDADKVVPLSYSERAEKVYKDADLEVIKRAGHGFKPHERAKAIEEIREFLTDDDD